MKKTISGIRGIVGDDLSVADVMEFCSNFCGIAQSSYSTANANGPPNQCKSYQFEYFAHEDCFIAYTKKLYLF